MDVALKPLYELHKRSSWTAVSCTSTRRRWPCSTRARLAAAIDDMTPERAMLLPSGRRRRVITSALEDRLRTDLKARRSFSGAADYLGFSLGRLRLICDDGLLPVSSAVLSERDITNFEARLTRHATDAQVAELDHCLAHVLRTVVTRRETGPFLRAVMAGAISLRLKSNPYPVTRRLYMCIEDVQAWRSARRDSVALDFVSKEEARRFLNVKWEVLCHLIRHGHLRTIKRRTGRRCSEVVLIKELERFQAAYVPLVTFAKENGLSSKHAPLWAKTAGIQLVAGPTIDGCRQYIARTPRL